MQILNKYVGLLSFICALLLKLETSIQSNAEKLMCAFITFSLDCWSSLLSDCSKSSLKILQSIQNAAVERRDKLCLSSFRFETFLFDKAYKAFSSYTARGSVCCRTDHFISTHFSFHSPGVYITTAACH